MSEPSPGMVPDAKLAKTEGHIGLNPEKLAYILIGVCCELSIICLIVVAVSIVMAIGYKIGQIIIHSNYTFSCCFNTIKEQQSG